MIDILKIKEAFNHLKKFKDEKQYKYMLEFFNPKWDELNLLSEKEKIEILQEGMVLNKKSHLKTIATHLNININDPNLKLWKNLENCNDNAFAISLMNKQINWMEKDDDVYFFEKAFSYSRRYYIDLTEKKTLKNLINCFINNINVNFLLNTEETTGLSNWSYFIHKYEIWGNCLTDVFDIKPGWLEQDYYNIINGENTTGINEKNIDWNRIEKKKEKYSDDAIHVVREVLDKTICQKINGKFIFESKNIPITLLSEMWLLKKEHFELNIFTAQEKEKIIEKFLNDKSSFIYINSQLKQGLVFRYILDNILGDDSINWKNIQFTEHSWDALKIINLEGIVKNNVLRSELEKNLEKNNKLIKKYKI